MGRDCISKGHNSYINLALFPGGWTSFLLHEMSILYKYVGGIPGDLVVNMNFIQFA